MVLKTLKVFMVVSGIGLLVLFLIRKKKDRDARREFFGHY